MTRLQATVERIVPGGLGLIRIDGRVVLLPGVAPGDIVEVDPDVTRPVLVRVVKPGPHRVKPVCQDLDRCGACDLMHLSYAAQLAAKRDIVNDCLRRIGRFAALEVSEVVPSPDPLAYRSRAAFHVTGSHRLGYLARGTHLPVDIERCHVLVPELEAFRAQWHDPSAEPRTRLQALAAGGRISTTAGEEGDTHAIEVGGERYDAASESFFQDNLPVAAMLVEEVLRRAAPVPDDTVLELYAGVGLFTIPLARRAGRVITVESDLPATGHLRRMLQREGITNVAVSADPVERWLRRAALRQRVTTAVADPPRSGMRAQAVNGLLRLRPSRIVMVSCDPATMARDLRRLVDGGFRLEGVNAFDMFPQTHHVETVSCLVRTP